MANLTFANLQTEVFDQTGLDSGDTNNQTRVQRWLNFVQQDVCARWPWSFLFGRESIASITDYQTGTVSVNSGSTALTGAGTTFVTAQGDGTWYIQLSSANDWYNVSAFGGVGSLTLGVAYQQPTNAVNLTYVLRKFYYALSSSADMVMDIRNWNTPVKLIQCDFRTIDLINPLVQSTNAPYGYIAYGVNSSGNLLIQPYPFPDDDRLFEVRTRTRPVDMASSGDSPSIPNKYAHLLAFGATAIGFAYLRNKDMADVWDKKFETRLMGMKREYLQSTDYQPVLGSIDSISRSRWISFPSQYPQITG